MCKNCPAYNKALTTKYETEHNKGNFSASFLTGFNPFWAELKVKLAAIETASYMKMVAMYGGTVKVSL